MAIPQGPNQRWSLDFMSDALEDGRRFRVLNVIDDFSRECLAAVSRSNFSVLPSKARWSDAVVLSAIRLAKPSRHL